MLKKFHKKIKMTQSQPKINNLYCIDAVDGLSRLPDSFVDLTVTSPPYSDLRNYDGFSWNFDDVANHLFRVTKVGGIVVWVESDKTKNGSESGDSFKHALYFKELGFNLYDTMIYQRWSGPLTHRRYEQEFEFMFVFSKKRPNTFNPIMVDCVWHEKDSDRTGQVYITHTDKNRKLRSGIKRDRPHPKRIKGNVWKMNNSSQNGERYGHPAPFPEELAHDHIVSWTNVGDLVLDPFVGSGTTPKVAKDLDRNFIGFDLSQKYIEIAKRRLCLES